MLNDEIEGENPLKKIKNKIKLTHKNLQFKL
jgi:hypothetical protein